jgi:hypothetical protein
MSKSYLKFTNKQLLLFSDSILTLQHKFYDIEENQDYPIKQEKLLCHRIRRNNNMMEEIDVLIIDVIDVIKNHKVIGFNICPPWILIK